MQAVKLSRYLLPGEIAQRRIILDKITAVFVKYGYQEIITPAFEAFDELSPALPVALYEAAFRFFDHSGTQMILRPDIKTQVARIVSTRLKQEKGPLKLFYSGDVYRARQREIGQGNQFHQIGIELFDVGPAGDKEVIKIMTECLKAVGLVNFSIEQTNVSKINSLPPDKKKALLAQDFVALGRLPNKEELLSVDIDYYTGLYFECFVPEMGYVLGSGGRYDNLCEKFGKSRKAVGFAFNLDKLIQALAKQKGN